MSATTSATAIEAVKTVAKSGTKGKNAKAKKGATPLDKATASAGAKEIKVKAPAKKAPAKAKIEAKGKGKKAPAPAEKKEKRSYGLDTDKIKALQAEKIINPFRVGSSYWGAVESAISLGKNKFHDFTDLLKEYQKQFDRADLQAFKAKPKRNDETGADFKTKVATNFYVVCRNDYGKPCRDLKWEMRYLNTENGKQFGYFQLGK